MPQRSMIEILLAQRVNKLSHAKFSFCWSNIVSEFEKQFSLAFKDDKKAHLDNVPEGMRVIDGAKGKWTNILLMDGIISLLKNKEFSGSFRRTFNQSVVLYECILNELKTIDFSSYQEIIEGKISETLFRKEQSLDDPVQYISPLKQEHYSHLFLQELDPLWASINNLRLALLDGPSSKAKNKYSNIVDILTTHEILVGHNFDLASVIEIIIFKTMFELNTHRHCSATKDQSAGILSTYKKAKLCGAKRTRKEKPEKPNKPEKVEKTSPASQNKRQKVEKSIKSSTTSVKKTQQKALSCVSDEDEAAFDQVLSFDPFEIIPSSYRVSPISAASSPYNTLDLLSGGLPQSNFSGFTAGDRQEDCSSTSGSEYGEYGSSSSSSEEEEYQFCEDLHMISELLMDCNDVVSDNSEIGSDNTSNSESTTATSVPNDATASPTEMSKKVNKSFSRCNSFGALASDESYLLDDSLELLSDNFVDDFLSLGGDSNFNFLCSSFQ